MRAADECHPLPDQLHPCSWFSWFCSNPILRLNLQPRRSMRFTTPSIASAGESVFASEKYSFPKPEFPSRLLVSSPASALRFHFFGWLSSLFVFYFPRSCDLVFFRTPNAPNSFELSPCGASLANQDVRLREGSRLFCSSSREGDANAAIRNQVSEMRGSCFRAFFESSVLPPITRKNMCHFTRRSFQPSSFEDPLPNLLRDSYPSFSFEVATPS
jgi:hypothetical protein